MIISFLLGYWLSVDNNNMSYIEPSEWDESNQDELEEYEESAGESVLRNERETMWDSINRGISHERLSLNNII